LGILQLIHREFGRRRKGPPRSLDHIRKVSP